MGLLRSTVERARQRPSRLLLTGCALIVTTFFLAGSVVFGTTLRDHLVGNLSRISEGTDVVVRPGGEEPLTDEELQRITALPEVESAQPTMSKNVLVQGAGRNSVSFVGTAMRGPHAISTITAGSVPVQPHEVALATDLAERLGKHVGDRIVLVPGSGAPHATMLVSAVVEAVRKTCKNVHRASALPR